MFLSQFCFLKDNIPNKISQYGIFLQYYFKYRGYNCNFEKKMKRRFLLKMLELHLSKKHISLIVGPRQVGKTTLMLQLHNDLKNKSEASFFLSLEDKETRLAFDEHPERLFMYIPPVNHEKRYYVFIDEIQYLKDPSNFLKYHYDKYNTIIKFIVSGSSNFYIDKKFTDSLAGRKRLFKLPTLSFEEFLHFKNREEFLPFLNSGDLPKLYKTEIDKIMHEYMIYGAYPEVVTETSASNKVETLKELATSYIKKDIIDSNIQSPELYYKIMQILAENSGSLFNINTLSGILQKSNHTVENYVYTMIKSFHVCPVRPFYTNLVKEIRKMPKLYFTDLGLRNYLVKNFSPLALRDDKGKIFENFVFRRFYDRYDEMDIQFWLTQKKHEIDFIVNKENAFELKFSSKHFDKSKYRYFTENYPDIPLQLIHYDNVNEIKLNFSR